MTEKTVRLILLDDDPIFQLGFTVALQSFPDLEIISCVNINSKSVDILTEEIPDILVLAVDLDGLINQQKNLGIGTKKTSQSPIKNPMTVWQLCQIILIEYPHVPILIISNKIHRKTFQRARKLGIKGYCTKGTSINNLVDAIRQIAKGGNYWQALEFSSGSFENNRVWGSGLLRSGLQQIAANLEPIEDRLQKNKDNLSFLEQLFLSGRKRELLTAFWLLEKFLAEDLLVARIVESPQKYFEPLPTNEPSSSSLKVQEKKIPIIFSENKQVHSLWKNISLKIKSGLKNKTRVTLEIDILQEEKKEELLYSILNQLERILEELIFLKIDRLALSKRSEVILRELWQASTLDFLSKYYNEYLEIKENNILEFFLEDSLEIQETVIKTPFLSEILNYILFDKPLTIEKINYRLEAPESKQRAEILLENLIINIANEVMQIILNNFYDVEIIKERLYQKKYLTSREIAKFRNELSWRYRQEKYFEEPKNIFESKYRLFYLDGHINNMFIYHPRHQELNRLKGIPWAVTIALETRDALSPRFRAIASFLGKGLVYFLTEVIGRGIGLVGKGIAQSVGNSWSDSKNKQKNH